MHECLGPSCAKEERMQEMGLSARCPEERRCKKVEGRGEASALKEGECVRKDGEANTLVSFVVALLSCLTPSCPLEPPPEEEPCRRSHPPERFCEELRASRTAP